MTGVGVGLGQFPLPHTQLRAVDLLWMWRASLIFLWNHLSSLTRILVSSKVDWWIRCVPWCQSWGVFHLCVLGTWCPVIWLSYQCISWWIWNQHKMLWFFVQKIKHDGDVNIKSIWFSAVFTDVFGFNMLKYSYVQNVVLSSTTEYLCHIFSPLRWVVIKNRHNCTRVNLSLSWQNIVWKTFFKGEK